MPPPTYQIHQSMWYTFGGPHPHYTLSNFYWKRIATTPGAPLMRLGCLGCDYSHRKYDSKFLTIQIGPIKSTLNLLLLPSDRLGSSHRPPTTLQTYSAVTMDIGTRGS